MKRIKLILAVFLLIGPIVIFGDAASPTDIRPTGVFIKTDEQGNYINDAEFKIHSVNGNVEYEVWKTTEPLAIEVPPAQDMSTRKLETVGTITNNGQYEFFATGESNYNEIISILGTEEKQILEDLKIPSKLNLYGTAFYDTHYASEYAKVQVTRGIDFTKHRCNQAFQSSNIKDYKIKKMATNESCYNYLDITVPVIMILEETKAPTGLKKEKAILLYKYHMDYVFDENDNYLRTENVYYTVFYKMYKYNYDLNYSNILDLLRRLILLTNDEELYFKNDCGDYYHGLILAEESENFVQTPTPTSSIKEYKASKMNNLQCSNYPVIIDHENGAVLTISSYVNNGGSTKAAKGSKLNYKVVVRNEGTTSSTNNVITSKIPEGFEYVEGSASDNGVYLESANAIRWNIDEIGVESTKELTYKVSVSEDVDLTQAYISSATISNDGNDVIESNETRVILEGVITNPKTGDINKIIILFVLCVAGLILYYVLDHRTVVKL